MLEIMSATNQNYEFSSQKRKSLILKQNIGFQGKDKESAYDDGQSDYSEG